MTGLPASDAIVATSGQAASKTAAAPGEGHAKRHTAPNFDTRTAESRAVSRSGAYVLKQSGDRIQAFGQTLGQQGVLSVNALTGTPDNVARLDGLLTGPSSSSAEDVALNYVRDNLAGLGLQASDLATFKLRSSVTDIHGVTHVSWVQRVSGTTVFGNGLRAHVSRDGSLISLQGAPVSGLATLAAKAPAAKLAAADARSQAVRKVGGTAAAATAKTSADQTTKWSNGDQASRVYFMTAAGLRPGWSTYTTSDGGAYQHVIDAATGQVLYQRSTVNSDRGDALVTNNYPGARSGGTQVVVNLFKAGYLAKKSKWLTGNYVWAWADLNDDDVVQKNEKTLVPGTKKGAQFRLKTFLDASPLCSAQYVCTWDPDEPFSWRANKNQDATQGFYLASLFHDYLESKPIGFTTQMGNFEASGGDPVLLHVLDGANTDSGLPDGNHIDNANMSTPPDGVAPTMQMYLNHVPGTTPDEDPYLPASSSDAADNIFHEYTHGLSNRLVVDASGNSTLLNLHAGSMGEGWSDYYAMDYLVTKKLLKDTEASGQLMFDRYLSNNRPLTRSEAIDCAVGSSGRLCTKFGGDDGGYTFGDLGNQTGGPEVHADSEIWSQTLWDLRGKLGHRVTAALVTEAMSLSPADPTFLDERNAIVAADQAIYGGDNTARIWKVFAHRGMGWLASAANGNDADVSEDFSLPPAPTVDHATLFGTVVDDVTGEPLAGVTVAIGGHLSQYSAVTDAQGEYEIPYVPVGDYPEVVATLIGYDVGSEPGTVTAPSTEVNFELRRDWAAIGGGGSIADFSGPDFGPGCGPSDAIDQSFGEGWSTEVSDGNPTETPDPKYIVVKLPEPVDITAFGIDPSNTCGDGGSASMGDFSIEVSLDGAEFSPVASGTFDVDDRGQLNDVAVDETLPGVQYVKVWIESSQVPDEAECEGVDAFAFSGCTYMDLTEFEVFGSAGGPESEDVQILSFNDFHGHLEATDPPLPVALDPSATPAGGVEYLATAVKTLRAQQPESTLTVAAGDLIGGSTFLSGIFQDQPSIEAMNELGLDVSSVGNHEFDEGTDELLRMVNGGCFQDECFKDENGDDIPYEGTDFDYLAANVVKKSDGETLLPGTAVKEIDGIPVGFIGMTLEATPTLVSPAGVASVDFLDEVETANAQAAQLKSQGVETIIVLLHEGGYQTGTYNGCTGISGPIVDIASQVTPEVDLFVTGHTHQPYNCVIDDPAGNPRAVTSAASYGQVLTETHLTVDRATREVIRPETTSQNHIVVRTVTPDAGETAIINFWKNLSAPIAGEVVGTLAPPATDIVGDSSTCRCEETPMVDLVADAILEGTSPPDAGGAEIAFMNTGGVRASLRYNTITNGEQPGEITYAEAYAVAPFNNILVTIDLTGAQIEQVLNQQYQAVAARGARPMLSLGVSDGFTYEWAWDGPAPAPNTQPTVSGHVVPGSMELDGVPLVANDTYRVGTLNFLADGGDLFTGFMAGTNRVGGPEDLPNLVDYFGNHPGLTPPPDRVTGL